MSAGAEFTEAVSPERVRAWFDDGRTYAEAIAVGLLWAHGSRTPYDDGSWSEGEPEDREALYRFEVGDRGGELQWSKELDAWFVGWDDAWPEHWSEWPEDWDEAVRWRLYWPDGVPV